MASEKISKMFLDQAKDLGVDDEENLELMDMMIMKGLIFDPRIMMMMMIYFHFLQ